MDNALNKLDEVYVRKPKIELYRDNFQNYKRYGIPKAQLVIADISYNIGADAYGSNPMWYKGGDNSNGESKFAKSSSLIRMGILKLQNICTFAIICSYRNQKKKTKPPQWLFLCF